MEAKIQVNSLSSLLFVIIMMPHHRMNDSEIFEKKKKRRTVNLLTSYKNIQAGYRNGIWD